MRTIHSILISLGIFLLLMTVGIAVAVEAPAEEWNQTFYGPGDMNIIYSVQQIEDGYILAGQASFLKYDEDEGEWIPDYRSALLIKTDENGTEQWNRTFGSGITTLAKSVQQTTDGFILAGELGPTYENKDAWLIKTDENGIEQWNRTFGNDSDSVYDAASSVLQIEGGYILAGNTHSFGAGDHDFWLIRTDENGVEEWNKTFGGINQDIARSVQKTSPDGGYILAGSTQSFGSGNADAWLVKTNDNGEEEWNNTFGSIDWDYARSVQQTSPDGGYILAGDTRSFGSGSSDAWLIKTDENGVEEWNKTFGGTSMDWAESVQQTSPDGGYVLAGMINIMYSSSAFLIKTNENGDEQWNKTFSESDAHSVQQTFNATGEPDGYILAGEKANLVFDGSYGLLIKIAGTGQGATTQDPLVALAELQQSIDELELDPGIRDSLILRIDAAVRQLEKEDEDKAIKKLQDFIDYVNRLPTIKLDSDSSKIMIDEAENIIGLIENSEG